MGVIKRQGIKESIVRYVGVLIGMVNTLFIYTYFLDPEELGLIKFLQNTIALALPFMLLGILSIINRYFTFFRDQENQHNGFLFFALVVPLVGFLIVSGLSLFFWEQILNYYAQRGPLYGEYLFYLIPIAFFSVYISVLMNYSGVQYRIVIPSLINEFSLKLALPTLVILYYFDYIPFRWVVIGLTLTYGFVLVGILIYIYSIGHFFIKPNFSKFSKSFVKEIRSFGMYAILGSMGSVVATRLDGFMVGTLIDLEQMAVFSLAAMICTVIEIPKVSLSKIAMPVIADAWKEENLEEINAIYHKTSIIQFILGLWIFLCTWACVDELFAIIPKTETYGMGKYVIFILGLAKIIDMVTGSNSEIIGTSKYFKVNFYAILVLAVLNVITNLIFIPLFGIEGVALATLVAITLFNIIKFIFLKVKLNMQPFRLNTLWVALVAAIGYFVAVLLPSSGLLLIDIGIKCIVLTTIFWGTILWFKLSPDFSNLLDEGMGKVQSLFRK